MGQFGVGQPIRRLEDQRLLEGRGRYLDDVSLARQTYGVVLRAPVAHGKIRSIDTLAAEAAPGVLAVLTHADLEADGVGEMTCPAAGVVAPAPIYVPPRPLLVKDRVHYVGDYVAFVVAESVDQARDAADLVIVDYEELPAVVDSEAAVAPGAPLVWEGAAGNVATEWTKGDREAVDAAFERAAHVTSVRLVNNRVVCNSMETRGAIGEFDSGSGKYILHATTQGANLTRNWMAGSILKVPVSDLRVVTYDVGGGFGMKVMVYPEYGLVLWAARRLGRPVKWVSDRSDAFLSDVHGRDHVTMVELALDKDARFLAIRADTIANMGGCLSTMAPMIPTVAGSNLFTGLYRMPAVHVRVRCVFTNTVPVDAYRGAGRPEVAYAVERVVDAAARDLGLTPAELRRRNFVAPEELPYTTVMGEKLDSGDFIRVMDDSLGRSQWDGVADRKADALAHNKLRGIGMATYVECCGGGADELAELRVDADGRVTLLVGSQHNGQGHLTSYAQIIHDQLGIDPSRIRLVQGDTDIIPYGRGTGYSRSVPVGGSAVRGAAIKVVERCKKIAAHLLETAEADIEVVDGTFVVAGTDRSLRFEEIVAKAYTQHALPPELGFGIAERHEFNPPGLTFPNGCHVCEVEIDRDTGVVEIVRYTVADDLGKILNPLLVAGQVHGGCVQGIGQALLERTVFDSASGQLVTGSYMDYTMPRADDIPHIDFAYHEIPCLNNPLGIKGAGEAGAIGSPPAVINAIVDALSDFGVSHVDMPATPERIWGIINGAAR